MINSHKTCKRFILGGIATLSVICALTLVSAAMAAESATGGTPPADQIAPSGIQPDNTPPPPPFTKFNIYASGPFTAAAFGTNCSNAGLTCDSGSCSCFTFSGLPAKGGLAGATLSGQFVFEDGFTVGSDCFVTHGVMTATAHAFSINFGASGMVCYQPTLSFDHLQFTGNYIVQGGTNGYGHAAGTGSFTTDFPNYYGTETRSLVFNGLMQKAK